MQSFLLWFSSKKTKGESYTFHIISPARELAYMHRAKGIGVQEHDTEHLYQSFICRRPLSTSESSRLILIRLSGYAVIALSSLFDYHQYVIVKDAVKTLKRLLG